MHDLLIVGAGPAGLATAIASSQAGLEYEVVEKGLLVNSIFHFPTHMVFFTTADLLEIGGLPFVTPFDKPTRLEALRYYRRVVDHYNLRIAYGEKVESIRSEAGAGTERRFVVRTSTADDASRTREARAVVLAIGYYDHARRIDVPGEDLPHVSHYYKEAHPYYRKRVVVVGGRNSAAEVALELHRAGALVTLVHRGAALADSIKYWVKPDIENRIREGSIPALFETRVVEITPKTIVVERQGMRHELPADAVLLMTGYLPDFDLLRSAGVRIDPDRCVPRYDPETLETNVPNLFLAGGAVAGIDTAPIFIENGRFHGDRIVKVLLERRLGARMKHESDQG